MNFSTNLAPCTIINCEWIIDPNIILKIVQIVGEKIFVSLPYAKSISNIISKAWSIEVQTDKLDLIKI